MFNSWQRGISLVAKKEFILEGLNCANCANKIEKKANDINGVDNATLDFVSKKLKVQIEADNDSDKISNEIKTIVNELEPHVRVIEKESLSHSHEHDHSHGNIEKSQVAKIIIAVILYLIPIILKLEGSSRFAFFFVSYIVVGGEILLRAARNISKGQIFDENFLMALATIGAFAIGEYPEGVAVMLFYQIGELFQDMAVGHSRKSIKALLDIRPDYANLKEGKNIRKVEPAEVKVGDYIVVKPGEKIPLDGIVIEGNSTVDTSNLTGENVPRSVESGDSVLSGFVNNQGLLTIEVSKEFGESTVSKILDLVENASSKKAPTENFITVFARYYTPVVVISALVIAFMPPLLFNLNLSDWIYRALIFLVISCPCALVISIPLGFFGGIGGASKTGILIKGGNYLDALNQVDTIVMDKTGTLTKGVFKVTEIEAVEDFTEDEVLEYAAFGEAFSNHPIGKSIIEAYGKDIDNKIIESYREISGKGIKAEINGDEIIVGNRRLFEDEGIFVEDKKSFGTIVYVSKNNKYIGNIIISDEIKEDAKETISQFKELGIKETIMLSGDNKLVANEVGKSLGIDGVYGELLPQDKVSILEKIMNEKGKEGKVAFVGDGVNDAPVLARADVGIAMGGLGSDAAIEAADIVIMTDEPKKISTGIKISKRTKKIVTQNIIFALGVKLIVLILGAFGVATMWEAVFADVGVSIIAILNSMRALNVEE
ncbi:cadmium-translocating P-type ATPase [Anaerosalibacter bizertensis]|uniref:heavy metal translocating P-type ATPase n=1 Tax=Anaerosalibacter bizertensis TaxID=932217 RepID=UPI001C0ECA3F|nr:heavy metal translocating P-type ATPase [Anaerosalibacter bizertensis]MBU5293975.1 cadmium-translocating P-type ATPase [Anaerosalibacter bizertensis]MCG4581733.1 cadmium-translocating P-type ATPase [Anaerosalibacter bizertensis]